MRPFRVLLWLAGLLPWLANASPVIISEFMASNTRTLVDENGEYSDWIELFNTTTNTVNLDGWYLTDDAGKLANWRFPATNLAPASFLVVFASGKDRKTGTNLHTNFKLGGGGEYLALVDPSGTNMATEFAAAQQFGDVSYGFGMQQTTLILAPTNGPARVLVPADDSLGSDWTMPEFDDAAWLSGTNGIGFDAAIVDPIEGTSVPFAPFIATDIRSIMHTLRSTAYIRYPFTISNVADVVRLTLRMRYDDGFVAYLNGIEIASANAPSTTDWSSKASARHPDSAAVALESFDVSLSRGLLVNGTNILSIQGLNIHATNTDFLVQAELSAATPGIVDSQARYFVTPTPRAPNGVGSADLGPILSASSHVPLLPNDNDEITVTARVAPAFASVTNVSLIWRVMFGVTSVLAMFDDGAHGDGLAYDGIFGASIPASASTNGQMVRWFITAVDSQSRTSRWPLFDSPLESPEYLGTVISDPSIQSLLPVLQTFVENGSAADARTGTRCSLFYLGEFYDNVFIGLHGQTSANFAKKSYNLDFNTDQRFRYRPGSPRVKDIKLLTNWGDKSKTHNSLGYELMAASGSVGHFAFQVRVHRNGQFFSITDMVEDGDDLWLERVSRDPNGALYKIYNSLNTVSTAEKKTRQTESTADLQALITNLDETRSLSSRVTYAYDNLDLPQVISYFVACALISHQDHGHKNFYVYRDSIGSGEWAIFPWDIDLNLGRNWIDGTGYLSDTIYVDNVLTFYNRPQQNKSTNRLYSLVFENPDFRRMYLRRLRTVMDTILQAPGTAAENLIIEKRIREMMDLLDPPGIATSDADLDYAKWGSWGNLNQMRAEAQRIIDLHLPSRRSFLYTNANAVVWPLANPAIREGIPGPQPANAVPVIMAVEANPLSGKQDQEYVQLTNGSPFTLDISGWRLEGAVEFTFKPGTVMPTNSVLFVSPNVAAFRARTSGPRGNQSLCVQGNYKGQLSARGETLRLADPFGNTVGSFGYLGNPSLLQQYLRVTELMYHPSPLTGNTNSPEEFEYIELKNISTNVTLNLAGVRFANGIEFSFTNSSVLSLAAEQRVLLVKNLGAFSDRYGAGFNIAGQYVGSLDNGGERLQLLDAAGEEILDFSYNNSWYPLSDGFGFSLVIVDENAPADAWGDKQNWRLSGAPTGTPGGADPGPPAIAPILITEALTRTDTPPPTDSIELFNPTSSPANIGGWFLSDDFRTPKKYRISDEVTISANGFVVFDESNFNPGETGFALGSDGDEVWLFSADAAGNLTGYFHGFDFGGADDGISFGRYLTSEGKEHFVAQQSLTLNQPNAGPRVGPMVINELMYHPKDFSDGSDNSSDEFIELLNVSTETVPLFDPVWPANTWKVSGGVDLILPPGVSLTAGEFLLLINFDPGTNTATTAAFRNKYGVAQSVPLFGPYSGKLDNKSGTIELKKPSSPQGGKVPYVLVDEVSYEDSSPWPSGADGFGLSLQRRSASGYGNDPTNWVAALPSAAAPTSSGGNAPEITTHPLSQAAVANQSILLTVNAASSSPPHYQWRFRGTVVAGATNSFFQINNVQPTQTGDYDVLVYNEFGSAVSSNAIVSVVYPATILAQPQSVQVRVRPDAQAAPATNATFGVLAWSSSPLTYQWRFNSNIIPDATNSTLTVNNVQISNGGDYTVAIFDSIGVIVSAPATLYPLVSPTIIQPPVSQTVVVGGPVTLSVGVSGSPMPITYEWRQGITPVAINVTNSLSNFYSFTASSTVSTQQYRVIVKNLAYQGLLTNATITVITLADANNNLLPDIWETNYGVTDPALDTDNDGASNWAEYLAGTNPTNELSCLKLDGLVVDGNARCAFTAISNHTYTVQYCDALGSGAWFKLTDLPARSTNHTAIVPDPNFTTNRFYRVATPRLSD